MKITALVLMLFFLPVLTKANEISNPNNIPESDFRIPECPGTPNCVSSLATVTVRRVEPFPVTGDPSRSMDRLADIIRSMPRSTIVSTSGDRIETEFRSLLGFVDDLLFVVSPDEDVIHVRSASRSGTWDLGVNRRRVEKIRKQYLETGI